MNMNFSFLSNSTHNTTIVDAATNSVLFEVSTPFGFGKRTTTIANNHGEAIGVWERKWGSDLVTIRGETMKLQEWLHKDSIWSP